MGVNERVFVSVLAIGLSLAALFLGVMLAGKLNYSFGHRMLMNLVFVFQFVTTAWAVRGLWAKK